MTLAQCTGEPQPLETIQDRIVAHGYPQTITNWQVIADLLDVVLELGNRVIALEEKSKLEGLF